MMKKMMALLLAAGMVLGLLAGCGGQDTAGLTEKSALLSGEAAQPEGTIPADGNPDDVTCRGSYTADVVPEAVVARVGRQELANDMLQAFYWAEAAAWRQGNHEENPDFSKPLDRQPCPVDESAASWQQFFLERALNTWHGVQALLMQSEQETLPTEEAYQPNPKTHADNVDGKPATKFLYGSKDTYEPNTMHQAYLDQIPEMLETLAGEKGYESAEAMARAAFGVERNVLEDYAALYNRAYMYFTFRSYDLAPEAEAVESWFEEHRDSYAAKGITSDSGWYVDIRHIQAETREAGETLLKQWSKGLKADEPAFAELAVRSSLDAGTAADGGAYRQLSRGQLSPELDSWCFDPDRKPGDTTVLTDDRGGHVLYYSGRKEIWFARAERDLTARLEAELLADAKQKYPMEAEYAAIRLGHADPAVAGDALLYPDIAHERFPEAPLYLQQDYPYTMYGGYPIRTHGCGITTLSMLSTYMTDTVLTPPEMCDRYGDYCNSNGTDGMIFIREPKVMGYYFRERVYEPDQALAALKEGYPVVCIQHKGYWTRGGHYLLLEELTEDGLVRVRDSNIANYGRLDGHKADKFEWSKIPPACGGYWVFEKKVTRIPACTRCGDPETAALASDYRCHKCAKAELRRETFLDACGT